MAVETGNQLQVAYIPEVTFKTTPATPAGKLLRKVGFTLNAERGFIKNNELRTDRQNAPGRGGVMVGKGEVSGNWSYATYDDLLEAALGGTWTTNVLKIGTTRKSFTFERAHKVNGIYFPFKGVVVNSFEISGKADDKVECKFGLIAAVCSPEAVATLWTSTTAENANPIDTTWNGTIKRGGTALGIVTSWSLKGDNAYQEPKVCGSSDLYDLNPGTCTVTGSMDLYFDSVALYTDFRTEASVTLQIVVGDGVAKSITFDLTDCRITKFGTPTQGEGMVTVPVDFESYTHTTNTALKATRTAA